MSRLSAVFSDVQFWVPLLVLVLGIALLVIIQ